MILFVLVFSSNFVCVLLAFVLALAFASGLNPQRREIFEINFEHDKYSSTTRSQIKRPLGIAIVPSSRPGGALVLLFAVEIFFRSSILRRIEMKTFFSH